MAFMAIDVCFQGLRAPLRLVEAEALLPLLAATLAGWPHQARPADPDARPFFTITAQPGSDRFWCEPGLDDRPARALDRVNSVCDAIAELALALPAEDDSLLCLHAAGVVMGGRVVIFPNIRRAGKSTLAAALAHAGHRVFSDDVLPISFPGGRHARVQSMGVAPRLRLPLPDRLPQGFRTWTEQVAGPENRQYRYLSLPDAPRKGDSLPVGAFVLLDRHDAPCPARLDPLPPDAAMDALLHQNFTRDRHSGDILNMMAATLSALPIWRLTYADLADAMACLGAAFRDWPAQSDDRARPASFRLADFTPPPANPAAGAVLVQRPGTVVRTIGAALYLAGPEGRAIQRMDPIAAAIWEILESPASQSEIAALLAEVFPGTEPVRIAEDVDRLIGQLVGAGLVAADPPET
jgi:hypothetical protein